jgi:hypothetical protein
MRLIGSFTRYVSALTLSFGVHNFRSCKGCGDDFFMKINHFETKNEFCVFEKL